MSLRRPTARRPGPKSVADWAAHWDAKAEIENPIELNGYCVEGVPVDAETYRAALIEPWLERLELEPRHHALEVGCGSGLLLREIEPRVERLVGADLSKALLGRYDGLAETIVSAAHELPFEEGRFDRILLASVSQYFPSMDYFRGVMSDLVRFLRRPGLLLLADVLLGDQPPDTPYLWYQPMEMIELLESLGVRFCIESQSELKRTINRRYDIVVRKG